MKKVTIEARLFGQRGLSVQLEGEVVPHKDKALSRITLGKNDRGRIVKRSVAMSCVNREVPYRWER